MKYAGVGFGEVKWVPVTAQRVLRLRMEGKRRPSDANVLYKRSRTAEERWYSASGFWDGLTTSCRKTSCYEMLYYGLNDPGFESRHGQEISPWLRGPPSLLFNGYRGAPSPG